MGEDGTGNSYICLTGNKCNVGVWGGREGRSDGSGCEEVGERERHGEKETGRKDSKREGGRWKEERQKQKCAMWTGGDKMIHSCQRRGIQRLMGHESQVI